MIKPLMIAAIAGLAASAAAAQAPTNDRRLEIFGSDRCPANTICVRAPESERFRIPKTIRDNETVPESAGSRTVSASNAGASGYGSCTASGAAGSTGCWGQQMRQARAERKVKKEEDAAPTD